MGKGFFYRTDKRKALVSEVKLIEKALNELRKEEVENLQELS